MLCIYTRWCPTSIHYISTLYSAATAAIHTHLKHVGEERWSVGDIEWRERRERRGVARETGESRREEGVVRMRGEERREERKREEKREERSEEAE